MHQFQSLFAQGAIGRIIRNRLDFKQTHQGCIKLSLSATAVDQDADGGHFAAICLNDIDRFLNTAAAGHHIFGNHKTLALLDFKAAQMQHIVFLLNKNKADAQRARHLVANRNTAHRRRDDRIELQPFELAFIFSTSASHNRAEMRGYCSKWAHWKNRLLCSP